LRGLSLALADAPLVGSAFGPEIVVGADTRHVRVVAGSRLISAAGWVGLTVGFLEGRRRRIRPDALQIGIAPRCTERFAGAARRFCGDSLSGLTSEEHRPGRHGRSEHRQHTQQRDLSAPQHRHVILRATTVSFEYHRNIGLSKRKSPCLAVRTGG
jgi:hypothetical protein